MRIGRSEVMSYGGINVLNRNRWMQFSEQIQYQTAHKIAFFLTLIRRTVGRIFNSPTSRCGKSLLARTGRDVSEFLIRSTMQHSARTERDVSELKIRSTLFAHALGHFFGEKPRLSSAFRFDLALFVHGRAQALVGRAAALLAASRSQHRYAEQQSGKKQVYAVFFHTS